jgi:uncharacterized membrane protein
MAELALTFPDARTLRAFCFGGHMQLIRALIDAIRDLAASNRELAAAIRGNVSAQGGGGGGPTPVK